jgi:hypothetical protein
MLQNERTEIRKEHHYDVILLTKEKTKTKKETY